MKHAEHYIDQVFRSAAKGFPEGLVYKGFKRCTPQEEIAILTRKRGTRRTFDTARSDIYMVKYFFEFKGKEIEPRYMSLPFVGDANSITISGSRFNIAPILSDRVISVGVDNIFVRLLRDKLTFERISHHYMVDGKRVTTQVAWSSIYHRSAKMKETKPTVKMKCALMHYLLCKYGFTDTFLMFGNCRPIIGEEEINTNSYPEDEWVICSSTKVKPKGCGKCYYVASRVRLAIRKNELTPHVKNMIGGFFYVVDHFSDRILPSLEYVDSRRLWKILLGHIIWSGSVLEGKLHDDVDDHITSLDGYLDYLVIYKLKDIGISIENIYQLFSIIIENFNEWILEASDKVASMYDKELNVLYYTLYEITSAIFKLLFKLKAASKKELTEKEITTNMNACLRQGLIYAITKGGHGETSTITCSGDNKAFKLTSLLRPQSESSRTSSRKDKAVLNDPSKRLHVSVAEIGNYLNLPKSNPDGRSRINPCVKFDSKSVVQRDPKFIPLLDEVQEMIKS